MQMKKMKRGVGGWGPRSRLSLWGEICIILGGLLGETGMERRKKDRYRQKFEDVFSGQEPVAKISKGCEFLSIAGLQTSS